MIKVIDSVDLMCVHRVNGMCVVDGIVVAQDLPEIVINVTWRNWVMNFIFSYNVQPYQISEKRTYLYIAKIDLTFTNLKVLCPVMQFLLI